MEVTGKGLLIWVINCQIPLCLMSLIKAKLGSKEKKNNNNKIPFKAFYKQIRRINKNPINVYVILRS